MGLQQNKAMLELVVEVVGSHTVRVLAITSGFGVCVCVCEG